MKPPACFEPTGETQRVLDLLTAMLREERKRERLRCQEACASVRREFPVSESVAQVVARCVAAIMALED